MQLGRYQIVREIARSNDIVYEAYDPTVNRRIALKELAIAPHLNGAERRVRIERFYREARAAGALSHPNILTIHEVGEDSGRYFIAMEYLEGQTLRERLHTLGVLSPREAVQIALGLLDALEYAHQRNVVHRDIKPDNVHLLPDGRVKLTDFGIARILHEDSLTIAGQIFGTPSYMAPEQIKGEPIDGRADIFSLGIVLYEMLCGRKPFTGDSIVTITDRIIHAPTPPAAGAPPAIDAAIRRATAKLPAQRFPTAGAFRDALQVAVIVPTVAPQTVHAAPAPTPTVAYGTRTQFGVAPHLASPLLPPETPASDPERPARVRRIALVAGSVLAGAVVFGVVGFAFNRALHNAQRQIGFGNASDRLNVAIERYNAKDYMRAAVLFDDVRRNPEADDASRTKASTYEGYCYRELGHEAQNNSDFAAAVKWYEQALAVSPNDAQARQEYDAARKIALSNGTPLPGPTPGPDRITEWPRPRRSDIPNVGADDFRRRNEEAAQRAQLLLAQGDQAFHDGNRERAREFWQKAVEAGPGSAAATDAQRRLSQNSTNVFGG